MGHSRQSRGSAVQGPIYWGSIPLIWVGLFAACSCVAGERRALWGGDAVKRWQTLDRAARGCALDKFREGRCSEAYDISPDPDQADALRRRRLSDHLAALPYPLQHAGRTVWP